MRLPNSEWLATPGLLKTLNLLCENGGEARVAGGAVRNALLGEPVADVDIATTLEPDDVTQVFETADFKVIPTGLDHGTVTAVVDGQPFEITTLRADIETDGRHAVVRFGTDWHEDALRRDFTINALYAGADGEIFDPLGGLDDIEARRVRFIGKAEDRIREDALRILRFFRFFAWYGRGAPDREGLKACVRLKDLLSGLSVERVWRELFKTLQAPDPSRAVLWMRQAGILAIVLPESQKWGIDALTRVVAAQDQLGWGHDPMLRLMAIVPPQVSVVEALGTRLKLSKSGQKQLVDWAESSTPSSDISETALAKMLYQGVARGIIDAMRLELARLREVGIGDDKALAAAAAMSRLLDFADSWQKPKFPVKGRDLIKLGAAPGEELGIHLKQLEQRWIDSGFTLDQNALLNLN